MARQGASETSPLLPSTPGPEPANSTKKSRTASVISNGHANVTKIPPQDEEAQLDGEEGPAPYEGMPEMKAKLKYILPAIGIGVWLLQGMAWAGAGLTYSRFSLLLQTKPSS